LHRLAVLAVIATEPIGGSLPPKEIFMSGIVYVFTNEAMPNLIKIGRTSRSEVEQRRAELSRQTGVPAPFIVEYAAEVEDAAKVESTLHAVFSDDRVSPNREFFRTAPHKIVKLLQMVEVSHQRVFVQSELDTEDRRAIERIAEANSTRRSNFRFDALGISVGEELEYAGDPTKKCRVVEGNKVEYNGEVQTLSALATKLRAAEGYSTFRGVAGTLHFLYDGELLSDRRDKMEAESEE
jgi:hypothetical protein